LTSYITCGCLEWQDGMIGSHPGSTRSHTSLDGQSESIGNFYNLPVRAGRSGQIRSVGEQEVDLQGGVLLVVDFEFAADTLVKDIVLEGECAWRIL
jgi:hypothetical protein